MTFEKWVFYFKNVIARNWYQTYTQVKLKKIKLGICVLKTKPTLTLFLRHFERFRSAKKFSEPATSKVYFKISKVPDAVEPWCSVFGYCPFDLRLTVTPKPRNGFPYESVENHKIHVLWILCKTAKQTRLCAYSVSQLASVATMFQFRSSVSRSTVKNVCSNIGLFLGWPDTWIREENVCNDYHLGRYIIIKTYPHPSTLNILILNP